jgi:HD-GYP domain-containing protein (c-di-GMP phosphodiesterase class II)/DNA-binding CsgD family transcriptional regulator
VPGKFGLAGVIAALSVTSDLTRGHPPGEAMRACLLATELARRAGHDSTFLSDVFYGTLMRFAGCAATSHEAAAALGGDDIVVRARGDLMDPTHPAEALRFLAGLGHGGGKLRVLAMAPRMGAVVTEATRADCEVGAQLTRRVGLPESVSQAVLCAFERYDGKGSPSGLAATDISAAARFAAVGFAAVMFNLVGGSDVAGAAVARWSGRALDPDIAAVFLADQDGLIRCSDPSDVFGAVVEAEPRPSRTFRDDHELDEALAAFGDAADLKSPLFQGHSRGVALLARAAAETMTVDPATAYRAGLVHDIGRVAIPTGIWERPGPLRSDDWEQVRLHPYHSGRILERSALLAPLGLIASRHHERLDGSGYPAGVRGGELDQTARLIAAADVWRALGENRPHRAALTPVDAARVMSEMALDHGAVRAVLRAADGPAPAFPPSPVELTGRELEVLRRLAAGKTKRQIATELFISPSTVHTHTVHIYTKCGVSTRAGLAMFAMRHGLAAATG